MVAPLGKLPVELLVSMAIFFAYVLGVFLEMISRFFRLITIAGVLGIFAVTSLAQLFSQSSLITLAQIGGFLFAALTLVNAARLFTRMKADGLAAVIAFSIEETASQIAGAIRAYWGRVRRGFQPDYSTLREILEQEVIGKFGKNKDLLPDTVQQMDVNSVSVAAEAMGISVARIHEIADDATKKLISSTESQVLFRYYIRKNQHLEALVRQVIDEDLHKSTGAQWAFAQAVYDLEPMRKRLRQRLNQADVDLRKDYPEIFQECDRIRAEGEFRRGISVPLMILLTALAVLALRLIGIPVSFDALVIPIAGAMVVGGSVHLAGSHKIKESDAILYSCIKRGLVKLGEEAIFGDDLMKPTEPPALSPTSLAVQAAREFRTVVTVRFFEKLSSIVAGRERRTNTAKAKSKGTDGTLSA
ncbi:hypothetical protein GA0070561_6436 [Micromonospora saelicesensis]|uniref:Uncharacterized protein n=2 Tax=Micromonospora saelicesensis TaxID=285676 RepID=A0A1C5A885_9ACTN|nr:hypothetical protein GA0070561_6436 [Micromonospora saelicesensis]